ncbi:MAG: sigma-70 family RNA polymerase sigma factor [Candidatus Pacebacteria bacterium]|nr:sigma-70 family RNA polymerase sigma factor [Candidatus Paceibacterota bacterium]
MEKTIEKTDQELVSLALQEKDLFLYIVKRYQDPLLRYIKRLGNFNNEDASDILQETFIKIYKNLNAYNPELKFSSWAYRICHNQTINHFRKNASHPVSYLDPQDFSQIKSSLNLHEKVANSLDMKLIEEKMYQLKPKYRDVIILRFLEEKDYQEISDILKKPVGTVSTLINRAKNKLKTSLLNE